MDFKDYIEVVPGRRSGKPCVIGTRITVRDVLEYLGGGMSIKELLDDFPCLSRESVEACLLYAKEHRTK